VQGNAFYPSRKGKPCMTQTCCETEAYTCGSAEARKFNFEAACPCPYTKAWGCPEARTRANT